MATRITTVARTRTVLRGLIVGSFFCVGMSAPAMAAPAQPQVSAAVAMPASNTCGLPTHATPGSTFVQSFHNCYACLQYVFPGISYCTYNPSNGLTDLHDY